MRWIVYVFLGGAINTLVVYAFSQSIAIPLYASLLDVLAITAIPIAILFGTPILVSIGLTRLHPERRVVSPLYIQLLTLAAYLYNVLTNPRPEYFAGLVLLVMYAAFGGLAQNQIVASMIGLVAVRDSFLSYSFLAWMMRAKG